MSNKQERFIQDLVQFYRNRGVHHANPKQFVARLNGKIVNLCELYSHVLEYGGSYKVNQGNFWEEIFCKLFKTPFIGANFAVALRQIYNRYLLQYERTSTNNTNFTTEQWNEEEDEENLFSNNNPHSNSYYTANTTPLDVNNVIDSLGQIHNDSKLYCSLLSGLPNELNFAFNVTTILSNCNRFDWTNDCKLINVLLESMKSYCCICDQLEEDATLGRSEENEYNETLLFKKFIRSSINNLSDISDCVSKGANGDIEIDNFEKPDSVPLPRCPKRSNAVEFTEGRCNCYRNFWFRICLDEDVLNLVFEDDIQEVDYHHADSSYVLQDIPAHLAKKIEQRIELIAGIILNISVTYDQNNSNKVSMIPLIKFLVLLLRSESISYLNLALDILSNIAPSLSFSSDKPQPELYYCLLDALFRKIMQIAAFSSNIHNTTKSFEILARYIACMNNEANLFLETHLENFQLYERITQLLTCQYDIALLLALLEFCLTISEARPYLLVQQGDNKIFLKILVNLLNCDASQHFTTGAFKKVKIVDERPKQEVSNSMMSNLPQQTQNISMTNSIPKPPTSTVVNSVPVSNVNQSVLDNESFALNWLRTSYEEFVGCSLKVNDVYAEYVKFCCRNSRKNVIAAQSFSFLIKRCFPSCNLNANQSIVEGLSVKTSIILNSSDIAQSRQMVSSGNQIGSQQQQQLMSPILKAHLSTPPKNNGQQSPGEPNQSVPTANTSTLIKSLLANKLRNNQQTLTVQSSPIVSTNSSKPIATQVTSQPLINSTPAVVMTGENSNAVKDLNSHKNVIFANNPATTYALTPNATLGNNIIVQNANVQQSPQIGGQQILVVRTILTAPGQQNPVRLILPASMLTQQRLSAPISSTMNGLVNTNNVVQTITTAAPQIIQTQMPVVSMSNSCNNIVVSNVPTIQTNRSMIANSSPLLNVLLDKGKLPDFPAQSVKIVTSSAVPIVSSNVVTTNAAASTIQQQNSQQQMFILTTTPAKQSHNEPIIVPSNSIAKSSTLPTQANDTDSKPSSAVGTQLVTPIVNGNIKPSIVPNNPLIKHALESSHSSTPEVTKRLKTTSNHISDNEITENSGLAETTSNSASDISANGSTSNVTNSAGESNTESRKVPPQAVNGSSTIASNLLPATPVVVPVQKIEPEFECQWNNCQMKFVRPSEVFYHVHTTHIMTPSCPNLMNCIWGGPEGRGPGCHSKRPKLSLLTHLQDFHCNANVLKQELLRKKQISLMGSTTVVLPQPPPHPGYAQNAAMLAIRRHANNYVENATAPSSVALSPLTVSIRLTTALILRNLAKRSHSIKKSLELFEPQLCEVSISEGRDESRTIAQCLALIYEKK